MSEQPPDLNPRYQPAKEDTAIVVRFFGNTARVASVGYKGEVDPFQMRVAAWYLEREAEKVITMMEQGVIQNKIAVTGHMPPADISPSNPLGLRK